MPFHSRHTLTAWVDQFIASRGAADQVRVAIQDGADGADTGLVIVPLRNTTTSVFIQPCENADDLSWCVTIEPQPNPTELRSFQLSALAAELQVAAELCAHLEAKSLGHYEPTTTDLDAHPNH